LIYQVAYSGWWGWLAGEGEKLCSGEVMGDDGLGGGQMAKEVSQLLQQFKDKVT